MGDSEISYQSTKTIFFIISTIALILFASNSTARLYKWIDADGNTRYGDQLPQNYVNKKHFQLDAEGRIILTKEAGKSPEQIRKERVVAKQLAEKKERLAKEAAKKRQLQQQQDRVLLLTFNSEDDIFYARDQRLQVLDSKISLLQKNKRASQKKLMALDDQANKQYHLKNIEVPGGLQQKIEQMNKKILSTDNSIQQSKSKREDVLRQFNKDLTRFRDLKARQQKNKK